MRDLWFHYLQLQSFYRFLIPKTVIHRPLTEFQQLCISSLPPTCTISKSYALIFTFDSPDLRPAGQWNLPAQFMLRNGIHFLSIHIHFQWLVILKNAILNCFRAFPPIFKLWEHVVCLLLVPQFRSGLGLLMVLCVWRNL